MAELRPAVHMFAKDMEARLRKNGHKTGWRNLRDSHLVSRLVQELGELLKLLNFHSIEFRDAVIDECADVANFAMMIADNHRGGTYEREI